MTLQLKFIKTDPAATEPTRFEDGSVGYDLHALKNETILPNRIAKIDTGIIFEMYGSYTGLICDKSGIVTRKYLKVVGGVIDASYRGSIQVCLLNLSNEEKHIFAGEKIAQMLFIPILIPKLIHTDEIDLSTIRGTRGFGGFC